MTDSSLMEASCIHGEVWYECRQCEIEVAEYFEKLEKSPIDYGPQFGEEE